MTTEKTLKQKLTPSKATSLFLGGLLLGVILFGIILPLVFPGWTGGGAASTSPFDRPFPFPNRHWGENQEFYVFASGGQQGGLYVYSIPAMKTLSEIPVFSPDETWGWTTEDPRIRTMLTNPWTGKLAIHSDTRQPALSLAEGAYDGRWIFINDMLHPRLGRVDLDVFRTGEILWLPNVNGGVASLAVNSDTSLIAASFEHGQYPSAEIIEHLGLELDAVDGPYVGGFAGVSVDAEGGMSNAWQVWTPWQHDAVRIGWGQADGWIVTTSYNIERAVTTLGMLGAEEDYLYFWNIASIEQAIADGKYTTTAQAPDVPVVSWQDIEAYVTSVPVNPSGVDISPTGKYVLSGGKATATVAVVDFDMVLAAIAGGQFDGDALSLPILAPDTVRAATLDLGMGPTRAEFDDQGYAYIGSFVDSVIWKIPLGEPYTDQHGVTPWEIVESIPTHYSLINPLIPGGDTAQPYGQYLLALNKLAKNSFLPHGPLQAENHELYYLGTSPGQLIDQMPVAPETHAAQALPVSLLQPITAYERTGEKEEPRVEYDYDAKEVRVYADVVRSFFNPEAFTVPQGWRVVIHMTSLESALDISHGLAIDGYDVAVSLDPGEIRDVDFVADEAGVHWYYCLWYCSELHKEMRGRMIVIPEAEWTPEMEWKNDA